MSKHEKIRMRTIAFMVILGTVSVVGVVDLNTRATAQTSVVRANEINLVPGDRSNHPAVVSGPDLVLVGTSATPIASSLDAQNAIAATNIPWALGGKFMGQGGSNVTISAIYGVATAGHPGDTSKIRNLSGSALTGGCAGWFGPCDIPVYQCTMGTACTASGVLIPRIENRPVWIVDIDGATFVGSRVSYNHSVYAVDGITKTVLFTWGY